MRVHQTRVMGLAGLVPLSTRTWRDRIWYPAAPIRRDEDAGPVAMGSVASTPGYQITGCQQFPTGVLSTDELVEWIESAPPQASARLLAEETYGASGLEILSPANSATSTREWFSEREDMREGDVLVGRFLGDADRLVFGPSESGRRRLLVADPIDYRDNWYGTARTIAGFLIRYHESCGDAFWSRHSIFFDPNRGE